MKTMKTFDIILTNDPDHGLTHDYVPIFKSLSSMGLKVTTGVFCTIEPWDEHPNASKSLAKHCRKDETHALDDPAYKDLMLEIQSLGHEIAYHGYSQISNTREKFEEGLEIFKDVFGKYPFTYIEHGGNPKKHDIAMCKKETLAMDGANSNSKYFVQDIIVDKINCTWAYHDLLDGDYNLKTPKELFYNENGMLLFKRHRMNHFINILNNESTDFSENKLFIGYTHFGYQGYKGHSKMYKDDSAVLECRINWPFLDNAINTLKNVMDKHNPTSYTIEEYVKTKL